jgi:hypothetical protein
VVKKSFIAKPFAFAFSSWISGSIEVKPQAGPADER